MEFKHASPGPPRNHDKNQGHLLPFSQVTQTTSSQPGFYPLLPRKSHSEHTAVFSHSLGSRVASSVFASDLSVGVGSLCRGTQQQGCDLGLGIRPEVTVGQSGQQSGRKAEKEGEKSRDRLESTGTNGGPCLPPTPPSLGNTAIPLVTEFHTRGPGLREAREDTQQKTELPPYCPCQWGKPADQQRVHAAITSGAFRSIDKWLLVHSCLPNLTQVFLVATANLEVYVEGACRIIPAQLSGCSSRPPHNLRETGAPQQW